MILNIKRIFVMMIIMIVDFEIWQKKRRFRLLSLHCVSDGPRTRIRCCLTINASTNGFFTYFDLSSYFVSQVEGNLTLIFFDLIVLIGHWDGSIFNFLRHLYIMLKILIVLTLLVNLNLM